MSVGKQSEIEQESSDEEDIRQTTYWSYYCLSAKDEGNELEWLFFASFSLVRENVTDLLHINRSTVKFRNSKFGR